MSLQDRDVEMCPFCLDPLIAYKGEYLRHLYCDNCRYEGDQDIPKYIVYIDQELKYKQISFIIEDTLIELDFLSSEATIYRLEHCLKYKIFSKIGIDELSPWDPEIYFKIKFFSAFS